MAIADVPQEDELLGFQSFDIPVRKAESTDCDCDGLDGFLY
ncbi:hypothetical protein [Haladaptatus caseinilyticus]|nr:hypothetical protein [Haladaptatus caseinilyticus]